LWLDFTGEKNPGLHSWDRAVAYYTGSLDSKPDLDDGKFLYSLANEQCSQFRTCSSKGNSAEGEAFVNSKIFDNFRGGQTMIMNGDCEGAKTVRDSIMTLMTVPLIQGTLRYAHLLSNDNDYWEPYGGNAAAFALSVLPHVHECNKDDAKIIHDQLMSQNNPDVDFDAVKRSLQRNYACLKVSCKQVGGIYFAGKYLDGAEPCHDIFGETVDLDDDQKTAVAGLGIALGVLIGLGVLVCMIRCFMEKRIRKKAQSLVDSQNSTTEIL
jgi:hypothetical protein